MAGFTGVGVVVLVAMAVQHADAGCCSWGPPECGVKCGADANGVPANCSAISKGLETCNTYCHDSQAGCENDCGGTYLPEGEAAENCPARATECNGTSDPGESCLETRCCAVLGQACYQKDQYWASCRRTCTPGIDPEDPPEYQTPWSCVELGPRNMEVDGMACTDLNDAYKNNECCGTSGDEVCHTVKHTFRRHRCCFRH